jgi:hypothetical protein
VTRPLFVDRGLVVRQIASRAARRAPFNVHAGALLRSPFPLVVSAANWSVAQSAAALASA